MTSTPADRETPLTRQRAMVTPTSRVFSSKQAHRSRSSRRRTQGCPSALRSRMPRSARESTSCSLAQPVVSPVGPDASDQDRLLALSMAADHQRLDTIDALLSEALGY